jgi:hypothetical protein
VNRSVLDRLVSAVGFIVGIVLLAASGLLFYAHNYVHSQVSDQLTQQQIAFPPAGSKALQALPAADRDAMTQYAGQTMSTGAQAQTYAEHFIKVHLAEVAGGQTYAQVSSKALADPTNTQLAGQVQTLFRGETLRGLLLNAYAFDTMATVALWGAWISLIAGGLLIALAVMGWMHGRRADSTGTATADAAKVPLSV